LKYFEVLLKLVPPFSNSCIRYIALHFVNVTGIVYG
jgi:hypothetical protein